jgi:hypothetical protein
MLVQRMAIQALYFQVRNKIRTRIKNRPTFKDERFQENLINAMNSLIQAIFFQSNR